MSIFLIFYEAKKMNRLVEIQKLMDDHCICVCVCVTVLFVFLPYLNIKYFWKGHRYW